MKYALTGILIAVICSSLSCTAQDQSGTSSASTTDKIFNFPTRLFNKIQGKTTGIDQQLTRQTVKYLEKMARREARLQKKLYKVDSAAAKRLFAGSAEKYAALEQKMRSDTGGHRDIALSADSLSSWRPVSDAVSRALFAAATDGCSSAEIEFTENRATGVVPELDCFDQTSFVVWPQPAWLGE